MKYIIGMDVGTTATKGTLYDENGQSIAEMQQGYPLIQDKVDQAEEDLNLIFDAVQDVIFTLAKKVSGEIAAISWSSQMHSLIGLDENKQLLTNSITWADNRAEYVVEEAKSSGLAQQIYERAGMPIHPMAPIYKLIWLKQKHEELYRKVKYWLGIKEYLIFRLTGKMAIDIPMAAGTGLLNLQTLTWDPELLRAVEIDSEQLPELMQPVAIVGTILPEYSQKLNLHDTQIVLGASDGYLSTIGIGVLDQHSYALNVGTSGAVRTITRQPVLDKKARFFCYAVDEKQYLLGGPVNNGGISFAWAKNVILSSEDTAEDFLNLAQTVPAGSAGLLFLPYLGGERAPIWDANARGSFVGLTRNHTKPQMARSVLEGIIFNLLGASHALTENIGKPKAIRITGGFVKSDFVRQMLADVFNVPIVTLNNDQSGTFAAMFLARLALGLSKDMAEINDYINEERIYFPQEKNVQVYQELLPIYNDLVHSIQEHYEKIAKFQSMHPELFNKTL